MRGCSTVVWVEEETAENGCEYSANANANFVAQESELRIGTVVATARFKMLFSRGPMHKLCG